MLAKLRIERAASRLKTIEAKEAKSQTATHESLADKFSHANQSIAEFQSIGSIR